METSTKTSSVNTNPFSRAFRGLEKLFEQNALWAIIFMLLGATSTYSQFMPSGDTSSTPAPDISSGVGIDSRVIFFIMGVSLVILAIAAVVVTYASGVVGYVTWKTSKGEKAGFGEAFKAVTERFWTILIVQVLTALKIIGGLLLFVVPGIRAMLRYQMVLLPVFDENLTATKAMGRMKSLTKNHLMEVFGIATVGAIVPVIGIALQAGGEAILYPELKTLENHDSPMPKVHWLNYLGIILLALFALAVITVAIVLRSPNATI